MSSVFSLDSSIKGHSDSVTGLCISIENPNLIVSSSRDKTIIAWEINRNEELSLVPLKRLRGHSHFVSDVKLSSDGQFCISSWWANC